MSRVQSLKKLGKILSQHLPHNNLQLWQYIPLEPSTDEKLGNER